MQPFNHQHAHISQTNIATNNESIFIAFPFNYTGWAKKTGPFIKVYDSCI